MSLVSQPRLTMDQAELQYFNICRLHLLLIGQWPYQTNITAVPTRIIAVIQIISFGIEKTWRLIKFGTNMQIFIEDIPFFCMWLCLVMGYGCFWFHLDLLKDMLETIKHDWHCAMLNKEDHILEAVTKQGWKQSIFILSLTYAIASILFTFLFAPEYVNNLLPWKTNTSYPRQPFVGAFLLDPNVHFPLRFPYEYAILMGTVLAVSAMILQFHMLIIHACGMFTIFGHRLEHVFHDNSEKCIKDVRIHTVLVRILKHHKQIMQYVDTLNCYYAACYCFMGIGVIFTISSLLVNVCIYIKDDRKIDLAIFSALNLIGVFFNLHFVSSSAQDLLNVSNHVFRQMYWGEWYTASNSNQKILLLLMYKCTEPARIAFSTIFSMSLETFYKYLETSVSYFTVLYSLR